MKRLCSLILSMAMALSCMQMSAFAADVSATEGLEDVAVIDTVSESEEAAAESPESQEAGGESAETEEAVEEPEAAETVEAEEPALETADESEKTNVEYVLMNIPYAEFYKADVNNDVPVDAFTSATKSKTRTGNLVGGSYHVNSDGSDITGVTFPVKVGEGVNLSGYTQVTDENSVTITVTNRGQTSETTYAGKEALFESASYSYYVLNEVPAYYKEVTADAKGNLSFGQVQGDVQAVADGDATLSTESSYGDYGMEVDGLELSDDAKVYAVIISTKEGDDYGLRHMENIWLKTKLAWCTGFTTAVHNCPTSSAHYKKMMGQTINKVTYYTSDGIYAIEDLSLYVPVKFDGSVSVADAMIADGKTTVTVEGLPDDYDAVYSVDGLDVTVENGVMTFPTTAKKGTYTLTVSDKSGKYADLTADFILKTDVMPVVFDASRNALVATEGVSEEEFNSYLTMISSVSVDGVSYAATGRSAVTIVKEDGSIDLTAEPVAVPAVHEIVVSSTGYNDYAFQLDTRAKQTVSVSKTSYTKVLGAKAFSLGAKATGDSTLKFETSNKKVATVNSAGKVTIKGVGTAVITVTAGSDKQSSVTVTIKVNPKGVSLSSVKSSARKKLTVKWKKNAAVTGYQIEYSTNKNFKNAKKVTVKGAKKVSTTLSKLTSKKKYYVRIRTYKTVSKTNYYSSWSSKSMSAKVK